MFKLIDIAGGVLLVILVVAVFIIKRRKIKVLDTIYFKKQWNKVQKKCSNRKLWYQALTEADDLLDEALKKKKTKGKTPGERIVSSQHLFTANDSVWYSHKLANRIRDEQLTKVNKKETLKALSSFRQALQDVGALSKDKAKV
jgi:hypothetical protein